VTDAGLRRRELLIRTGELGLAAMVAAALPVARARAQAPSPADPDGILQAFADTMVPGRKVAVTESGEPVHPLAIAGVDREPGAVETDALVLFHHPLIGFDTLAPAFLADLATRSGGAFLTMGFEERTAVCVAGLAYDSPTRVLWEAAAAVPFTAFCAAGVRPEQVAEKCGGYRVMGLPGKASRYRGYSYRRKLSRERTKTGSLA
jgi:hypothetical protein